MSEDPIKIKITSEEVERVVMPEPTAQPYQPAQPSGVSKSYGRIASSPAVGASAQAGGSILMKAWFYLGFAGLVGAFLAWAICEPAFVDGWRRSDVRWGNILLFPLMVILMSVGFGIAESMVGRSVKKALQKGILSLILGTVVGFIFNVIANIVFEVLLAGFGVRFDEGSPRDPSLWISRAIAWAVFGIVGGIVYGVVDRSGKKCLYGVLGGAIGAGLGGFLFDPIGLVTNGAAASRAVGMMILGAGTGIAMGLVESALKDRWLYVSGGPLAGKQFILYKPQTQVGSQQSADIYLFKDPGILPTHALIEVRGAQTVLHCMGPVFVSGQSAQPQQILKSGDVIQIGRYTFSFLEKQRTQ